MTAARAVHLAAVLVAVTAVTVAAAAACGWIATGWNDASGLPDAAPGLAHLCGTDRLGRSVLAKIAAAAPASLGTALVGAAIATALGLLAGSLAGSLRGWADEAAVWLFSTWGSVPGLLLMVALALVLGATPWLVQAGPAWLPAALALGLGGWVGTARVVRNEVRHRRESRVVEAARCLGLGPLRIWWSHVRPFVTHIVLIEFAGQVAGLIQVGVVLSFLGVGPLDVPSWGGLIDEGRTDLARGVWWQLLAAAGAVLAVAVAAHLLTDRLRDRLDPVCDER